MTDIGKIVEAHTRREIRKTIQVKNKLIEYDISWKELEEWLEDNPELIEKEKEAQRKRKILKLLKCLKCNKPLNLSEIKKGSERYELGFRTYMLCGAACCEGKGCGWEHWSEKTIDEWVRDIENGLYLRTN